jgi:integrase
MAKKKRIYGEGTITLRKDGRYQIAVPGADGKRRYAYADSEREAEKERRRLLGEIDKGKVPASRQPFQQHAREWLEIKKKMSEKRAGYKPNSYIAAVTSMDAHFIPALGHIPLNKLAPSHIQKVVSKMLDDGLKPNSIRLYVGMLKVCLDLAVKQGKIEINPVGRVELPKKNKSKNSFLSQDEAMMFLEAVQGHKLFSILVPLALATEARISELLALTWADVNLEQGLVSINKTLTKEKQEEGSEKKSEIVSVTPKSESGTRDIPLPDFATEVLRSHRKQQLAAGKLNPLNLLFPSTRTGSYYWGNTVSAQFTRFAKKLGFEEITFHDLRHTGATLLLEAGIDPNTVRERLGHSDISITLGIYGHVTKNMKDRSAKTLDKLFTASQNGKNEVI